MSEDQQPPVLHPVANLDPYDQSQLAAANTAARALVLGNALFSAHAVDQEPGLDRLGFASLPPEIVDAGQMRRVFDESDDRLADYGISNEVTDSESLPGRMRLDPPWLTHRAAAPEHLWQEAALGDPVAGVAWLRFLAARSLDPLRQVAAAAALTIPVQDAPPLETEPRPVSSARSLLEAVGKWDVGGLAQQLAEAALPAGPDEKEDIRGPEPTSPDAASGPPSLIVHGTAAYAGDWWLPGGEFFDWVKSSLRPNLYAEGQAYSWSGKYSESHRDAAARRLLDWSRPYGGRLATVFAHSYGGVIALKATELGLRIDELVMLSTPREIDHVDWSNIGRSVSLRIHLDLVLLAARRRQSFDLPVAEHFLPQWFRGHSDSHEVTEWRQHDLPHALQLRPVAR